MNTDRSPESVRASFIDTFVRFGAGAHLLRPITEAKWWNGFCWALIVVGIVGWAAFIFWPY